MLIKVRKLIEYIGNPLINIPWDCEYFTPDEVLKAYKDGLFEIDFNSVNNTSKLYNVRRIAYFVKCMPIDPILLDVGIPSLNYYPDTALSDGWHRFYAAILRKDKFINASITGEINEIKKFK